MRDQSGSVEMEIPNVGIFYVKNGIGCIEFNEFLVHSVMVKCCMRVS